MVVVDRQTFSNNTHAIFTGLNFTTDGTNATLILKHLLVISACQAVLPFPRIRCARSGM
jgi:hypothetical protein